MIRKKRVVICLVVILCAINVVGCGNPTPYTMNKDITDLKERMLILEGDVENTKEENQALHEELTSMKATIDKLEVSKTGTEKVTEITEGEVKDAD